MNKTAVIICGALGWEVTAIIKKYGWQAEVFGIPAIVHMFPERIAPALEKKVAELREEYGRILILFGDCGSQGAVDDLLARLNLERIEGPHCYEMYGGTLFQELLDEEPGTFFLTDFLVRGFNGTILKGLGLDRFPELKEEYFRNYKRLVYLSQNPDAEMMSQAQEAANYLELPLEVRHTGYGLLEKRLVVLMEKQDADDTDQRGFILTKGIN